MSMDNDVGNDTPMSTYTTATRATSNYGDPFTPVQSSPRKRDRKITSNNNSGSKGLLIY
jgi:hypothetical protein